MVIRKVRKISSLPFCIIAVPLVLVVRIIRPFLVIRFGPIRNDVIGHFAFDTEYYLTESDIDKANTFDLFYFPCFESPNAQWELMVKRSFKTHVLFKYCDQVNRLIPGWEPHFARLQGTGSRDTKNIFIKTPCHISFTNEEIEDGLKYLRQVGVQPNQSFVCMIARDAVYKENYLSGNSRDWSYHSYRDSDIGNYVGAAELLTRQDYFIFRLGKGVKGNVEANNTSIVDYANSEHRSDFLDIYLSTHCRFFINGESGLLSVPGVFRVPIVFVNLAAIEYAITWNSNIISIPKKYWLTKEKRFMAFREIYESGAGRFLRTGQYEKLGIELIENTSDEILDVSMEMHQRLNSTWETTEEDEVLQKRFWDTFPKSELHGEFLARIGADFLRENRELLN